MTTTKILIVDDRPENLLTLESLLDCPNLEVIKAQSGEEALGLTLEHDLALVLLDVKMPGMDGYEVAELMRSSRKTKGIPIIFVTAERQCDHLLFKGYESGAVDYLFKPLNPVVLKSKVAVFIELFRQRRELQQITVELDLKVAELEDMQQQLEETNEQLLLLSVTDGLTGLLNRRQFDKILKDEWRRSFRTKKQLSLMILDIDHFKAFNDTYGHATGDECLKQVARTIAEKARREVDKVARIGGEEFGVILPETDPSGCYHVAERIRQEIEKLAIEHTGSATSAVVTVSIGIAGQVAEDLDATPRTLFLAADQALYRAKEKGRNLIEIT
nr:diguanylate cyclase [uncultured Desulfobulbus sp.]